MIQGFPLRDDFGVIGPYKIVFHDRKSYSLKIFDVEKQYNSFYFTNN